MRKYTQKFDGVTKETCVYLVLKFKQQYNVYHRAKSIHSSCQRQYRTFSPSSKNRYSSCNNTKRSRVLAKRPIQNVGLYIPGGSALFSTILMLAVPAQIAGCSEIVMCSPPDKNGALPDVVLYTANLCGIEKIYTVGGIQAIAAMTFGTESIPNVYKLFGPGNQYVTVAKQWATRFNMAIDMPAGPSELLVVADATANPAYIAADLLSQAEHGPDSQVILVTTATEILPAVQCEITTQLERLPRKAIAEKAIANSKIITFSTDDEAIDFINQYGPEHYIICMEK